MERLFVFADFNWLGKAELVGELCYEKLHGSESYAFKFDENWLKVHAGSLATLLQIPAREIDMFNVNYTQNKKCSSFEKLNH